MPIPQEKNRGTPLRPSNGPPVGAALGGGPRGSFVVTPGGLRLPASAYDPTKWHILVVGRGR